MKSNRIKNLRIDNDLSQEDIAKVLGISFKTYSPYEIGDATIPLKHLNSLCNYYNVSMDYILGFTDEKNYPKIKKFDTLDKNIVGNNIDIIMKDHNLSFRALAIKLNTTASTIHAYTKGKTLILTSFAIEICKKYNLSMDWLCGRSDIKYLKEKVRN